MSRRVNENGEPIVDTAIEKGERVMAKINRPIDNARAGVEILQELISTPFVRRLHFELDVEVGAVPVVKYTVERFPMVNDQKGEGE